MRHLLRLVSLRYLRLAPIRTLLTLFGILLGVGVIFAIDVVNGSVMSSFSKSIAGVSGKTGLTVGYGSGVAEEALEPVRAVAGVAVAVPVIEETVFDVAHGVQLAVLAVDTLSDSKVRDYDVTADDVRIEDDLAFLNDPHGVLVTNAYAKRMHVKVGDKLTLESVAGRGEFSVRGTLAPRGPAKVFSGDLMLMDVYAAQIAFGRGKRFDHIDVVPARGVSLETLSKRLEQALAGKAEVSQPQHRSEEGERILAGFKLGLQLASFVAIFVGAFIVYNALAIAVAQRKREIGILRALGTTRRQIMLLFVGEGMLLGTLGALLGVGFGWLLARSVLKTVAATVSALFIPVKPESVVVEPRQLLTAISFGLAASFVAAFFPARRAAFVEPATAMRKKVDASDVAFASPKTSLRLGGAALLLALVMAVIAHQLESFLLGYTVSLALSLALAFLSPAIARAVGGIARRIALRAGPSVRLGAVAFERDAGRNSVAIAALGMALANVVNATVFLDSMKANTTGWFNRTARADLFIYAGTNPQQYLHTLPETMGQEMSAIPGVEFVDPARMVHQTYRGKPFQLLSYELERSQHYNELAVVDGELQPALKAIAAGKAVAASETFARTFGVKVGSELELATPQGPHRFRVALIYVDFNSDLGILSTTRAVYKQLWQDSLVDTFGVYLKKHTSLEQVREQIARRFSTSYHLMVLGNRQYKDEMQGLLESSFALTHATEIVAVIVAVLGIVNTLLVNVIDRRLELGILKAIGAGRSQVERMFITEASLIGFASTVVGLGLGALFSFYIVKELVRFQVGWHLSWNLSAATVFETFAIAQIVAVIAGIWPMRSAGKLNVTEALSYE